MKVTICLCFNLDISSMREGSRWGSDGNGFWLSDALCSLLNLRPTTRIVLSFRGVVVVASQQGLLLIADSNQLQPPQDAVNDDTKLKLMQDHLGKFNSMLVAAARSYFVDLDEDDLNVTEKVHRDLLKSKLNIVFMKVRSYDPKLEDLLEGDPVEEVFLPYFTHQ